MKKKYTAAAVFLGLLAVSEAGGSAYFYRRTMKRNRVKMERTMKMAGTDWNQYKDFMKERGIQEGEQFSMLPLTDWYIFDDCFGQIIGFFDEQELNENYIVLTDRPFKLKFEDILEKFRLPKYLGENYISVGNKYLLYKCMYFIFKLIYMDKKLFFKRMKFKLLHKNG